MAQFLLSNARKIILVNKQSQQINIARTILNNNSHNRRDVVRQALIKRSFFSTPFSGISFINLDGKVSIQSP